MNKHPDSGTLLKDIDTILGELNALCAAHDVPSATTGCSPALYEARPRIGWRPATVKEAGPVKEKAAAWSVTHTKVPHRVTPLATLDTDVPRLVAAAVDLTVEYHTANGRFDARCVATDTVIQLWRRSAAEHGQCSHLVIRPYSPKDQSLRRHLNALERFYHSASAQLDIPQDSGQQDQARRQNAGTERIAQQHGAAAVLFSDDILPREDAATPATHAPGLPPSYRVLMMNSKDGAEYAWPVLYPAQWTSEDAMERATAAVSIVRAEDRLAVLDGETGICNYRHRLMEELRECGFMVTETAEGPVWD